MTNNKHNTFSIVGFILSIVSIFFFLLLMSNISIIFLPIFMIFSICGLVFSIVGLTRKNSKKVLPIIGIIITTLMIASILLLVVAGLGFIALY